MKWLKNSYLISSLNDIATGKGASFLLRKKEYHIRRAGAERLILEEGRRNPGLFHPNACPICGSVVLSERFQNPVGFTFAVCLHDGTVYMDPVPSEETLGRLYNADGYAFHWLEDESPNIRKVMPSNQEDYQALVQMLPSTASHSMLLDVGCASGSFMLTARKLFEVEGVELSESLAECARSNGLKVSTGRLQDIPGQELYDVITMLQVIEHIANPAELLEHVHRLLKPDGFLFLATPNIDSASFTYLKARHMHVSSFAHVSLLTKKALEILAAKCGFELTAFQYYGGSDLALHDAVTIKLSKARFRHRMSFYNPRLYHLCNLVERLTEGGLNKLIFPPGNQSYQRALFRKTS